MAIVSIILGVLMLLTGFTSLFTPIANMMAAGYIVGIMLLVFGIGNIVRAIVSKADALEWVMSILAIIVGIFAIVNPGGTLALDLMIMYMVASFFLIEGILVIVLSVKSRKDNSLWILGVITGVLSVLVGILSFANPTFAAVSLGTLISFFLIDSGINMITLGSFSRN